MLRKDPHCFWCGVELDAHSATLDHLYPNYHPFRRKKARRKAGVTKQGLALYLLVCYYCNQERGNELQRPFTPKLESRRDIASTLREGGAVHISIKTGELL